MSVLDSQEIFGYMLVTGNMNLTCQKIQFYPCFLVEKTGPESDVKCLESHKVLLPSTTLYLNAKLP